MKTERIRILTETGHAIEVTVLEKRVDHITVVIGEGIHSVKCSLTPTRNALAYVGSVMGREVVYERSRDAVQADIERLNPMVRRSSRTR